MIEHCWFTIASMSYPKMVTFTILEVFHCLQTAITLNLQFYFEHIPISYHSLASPPLVAKSYSVLSLIRRNSFL